MDDTNSVSSSVEGSRRLTLIDVADSLQAKYAFVSGGKSRMSFPILTFPECPVAATVTDDQHRNTVLYLAGIPEHGEANLGFVIVIDRRQDKWSSLRQLLLRLTEQYFPVPIQKIYVLQPLSFLQKAFADTSLKFLRENVKFKVLVLSSAEELHRHIDRSQVTSDLDGTLKYDHAEWMEHRTALEKFSANVVRIADMLEVFCQRLQETDFPNDVSQTESLIADHELGKQEIVEELNSATKHGEVLRDCFAGKTFGELTTAKTNPDSVNGNSFGSGSEVAPDVAADDDDADLTPFRKTHIVAIERLLSDLEGTAAEFGRFWKRHKRRLDQCLQLRKFEEQFKSLQFSCGRHIGNVASMTAVGDSLATADALLAEFQQFENISKDEINCAENLLKTGRQFIDAEQYAVDCIEPKCLELERIISEYRTLTDARRDLVQTSRDLHWKLDKANKLCTQGVDLLSNESGDAQKTANDVDRFLREVSALDLDKCRGRFVQIADVDTMHSFDDIWSRLSDISQLCSKRRDSLKGLHETTKIRHPSTDSLSTTNGGILSAKLSMQTSASTSSEAEDDRVSVRSNETKKWRAPFSVKNLKRSNSKSSLFNRGARHAETAVTTDVELTSGRLGRRRHLSNNDLDLDSLSQQPEIVGYSGSLDDLGEVLLDGSFNISVENRKDHKLMRELRLKPTSRHLFLYRQVILFCKRKENGVNGGSHEYTERTSYVFKSALQIKSVGVTENVKNDKKKFELWLSDKSEVYVLQATSVETKIAWLTEIKKLLQDQFDELRELSRTSSMGALNKLCLNDAVMKPIVCDSNGVRSARARKFPESANKNVLSCSMVNLHLRDGTGPQVNDLVAKGDYEALEDNELTIRDGERLQLVEAGTDNWSRVRSLATNQTGWVPARYLVPISNQSLTDVRPAMKLYNGNTTIAASSSTSRGKNQVNIAAQIGNSGASGTHGGTSSHVSAC